MIIWSGSNKTVNRKRHKPKVSVKRVIGKTGTMPPMNAPQWLLERIKTCRDCDQFESIKECLKLGVNACMTQYRSDLKSECPLKLWKK